MSFGDWDYFLSSTVNPTFTEWKNISTRVMEFAMEVQEAGQVNSTDPRIQSLRAELRRIIPRIESIESQLSRYQSVVYGNAAARDLYNSTQRNCSASMAQIGNFREFFKIIQNPL